MHKRKTTTETPQKKKEKNDKPIFQVPGTWVGA